MADLVEAFVNGVLSVRDLSRSNRRLAIRNEITKSENVLRFNQASSEAIHSFLQQAKDRAYLSGNHP